MSRDRIPRTSSMVAREARSRDREPTIARVAVAEPTSLTIAAWSCSNPQMTSAGLMRPWSASTRVRVGRPLS
jgi:hypothetical protein